MGYEDSNHRDRLIPVILFLLIGVDDSNGTSTPVSYPDDIHSLDVPNRHETRIIIVVRVRVYKRRKVLEPVYVRVGQILLQDIYHTPGIQK